MDKPVVTVAVYKDRIVSDAPLARLIDTHGTGSVYVDGVTVKDILAKAGEGIDDATDAGAAGDEALAEIEAARFPAAVAQAPVDEVAARPDATNAQKHGAEDDIVLVAEKNERRTGDSLEAEHQVGEREGDHPDGPGKGTGAKAGKKGGKR